MTKNTLILTVTGMVCLTALLFGAIIRRPTHYDPYEPYRYEKAAYGGGCTFVWRINKVTGHVEQIIRGGRLNEDFQAKQLAEHADSGVDSEPPTP